MQTQTQIDSCPPAEVYRVDEPGTGWLLLAALVLVAILTRLTKQKGWR